MASYRIATLVVLSSAIAVQGSSSAVDACSSSHVTKKLTSCLQAFTGALAGGDVCGSWSTFECCMTDSFSQCDAATKQSVADKVNMQKSTFSKINPNLEGCTANCAGSGSTPVTPPAKVEQTFDAVINLDDPTTFALKLFVDAVKAATGVTELPTAIVKAFEIIVQYTVPHAATVAQIKKAVATGNGVEESQVAVSPVARRRLGSSTSSSAAKDMDVTIIIDGSTDPAAAGVKAKAVKASAGAATAAVLKTALGGDVIVKTQPKATAKVETKVKAETSKAVQMKTAIESNAVGNAVGGTVTVPQSLNVTPPHSSHAASSFTAACALVMILFQATL